jgi:hypothetical protein
MFRLSKFTSAVQRTSCRFSTLLNYMTTEPAGPLHMNLEFPWFDRNYYLDIVSRRNFIMKIVLAEMRFRAQITELS